jgi:hypothetical protein
MIGRAISLVSTLESAPVVEYWSGSAWVVIADAVWHERGEDPEQDAERNREYLVRTATLTTPLTAPNLAYKTRIRIASTVEWARIRVTTLNNQRQYQCERREKLESKMDRNAL